MVSLFPLFAIPFRYFISAVEYKLQSAEQQARLDKQSSSAFIIFKEASVKKNRIINWIEPIAECLESLLKAFLGSSYSAGIALLVTIPALLNKNSQPAFPSVKIFWKRRLCHAGISFGIGVAKMLVLIKITGFIH